MFERFTDCARKAMAFANQEAQRLNHEYVGTEHILLGLLKVNGGASDSILTELRVDYGRIRSEVENLAVRGPQAVTMGKLPQTPRAKKVLEYAVEESQNMGTNYVGTEHLLLGLIREHDGVAGFLLRANGVTLDGVKKLIKGTTTESEPPSADKPWESRFYIGMQPVIPERALFAAFAMRALLEPGPVDAAKRQQVAADAVLIADALVAALSNRE